MSASSPLRATFMPAMFLCHLLPLFVTCHPCLHWFTSAYVWRPSPCRGWQITLIVTNWWRLAVDLAQIEWMRVCVWGVENPEWLPGRSSRQEVCVPLQQIGGGGRLVRNSWWLNEEEFGVVMRKRRQVRDTKQMPGLVLKSSELVLSWTVWSAVICPSASLQPPPKSTWLGGNNRIWTIQVINWFNKRWGFFKVISSDSEEKHAGEPDLTRPWSGFSLVAKLWNYNFMWCRNKPRSMSLFLTRCFGINPSDRLTEWAVFNWLTGFTGWGWGGVGVQLEWAGLPSSSPPNYFNPPSLLCLCMQSSQHTWGAVNRCYSPVRGPYLKEMAGTMLACRWLGNQVSIPNSRTQTQLHTAKSV